MKLVKILGVVAVAAAASACQHPGPYPDDFQAISHLIGSGLGRIEVYTPAMSTYFRADGSYCEAYRFRRHDQYGTGTVCRFTGQQWVLVDRSFDVPVGGQVPPPHYPPHPQPPATQPGYPPHPPVIPPAGAPGQWRPVNF